MRDEIFLLPVISYDHLSRDNIKKATAVLQDMIENKQTPSRIVIYKEQVDLSTGFAKRLIYRKMADYTTRCYNVKSNDFGIQCIC